MRSRRKRLPADLEAPARAFDESVPVLERAKAALTDSVPGTRLPGRPLAETLWEFETGLAEVRERMIVSLTPHLRPGLRVEQTHGDAHAIAPALQAALNEVCDAEAPADFRNIRFLLRDHARRVAVDHGQQAKAAKPGDDVLRQTFAQVVEVLIATEIGERQHSERWSLRSLFHRCALLDSICEDFPVELLGLQVRRCVQFLLERLSTRPMELERRCPIPGGDMEAHQRAIDRLAYGIPREQLPRKAQGWLARTCRRGHLLDQPDCGAGKPFALWI